MEQGDSIIRTFIWLDQYRSNDSLLHTKLDSAQFAFRLFRSADSASKQLLSIANERITERDQLIGVQEKLTRKQNKQIRHLRAGKTILGISTGILGGAAVVLLILL